MNRVTQRNLPYFEMFWYDYPGYFPAYMPKSEYPPPDVHGDGISPKVVDRGGGGGGQGDFSNA